MIHICMAIAPRVRNQDKQCREKSIARLNCSRTGKFVTSQSKENYFAPSFETMITFDQHNLNDKLLNVVIVLLVFLYFDKRKETFHFSLYLFPFKYCDIVMHLHVLYAGSTNFIILSILTLAIKGTWHFRQARLSSFYLQYINLYRSNGSPSIG